MAFRSLSTYRPHEPAFFEMGAIAIWSACKHMDGVRLARIRKHCTRAALIIQECVSARAGHWAWASSVRHESADCACAFVKPAISIECYEKNNRVWTKQNTPWIRIDWAKNEMRVQTERDKEICIDSRSRQNMNEKMQNKYVIQIKLLSNRNILCKLVPIAFYSNFFVVDDKTKK